MRAYACVDGQIEKERKVACHHVMTDIYLALDVSIVWTMDLAICRTSFVRRAHDLHVVLHAKQC